MSSDGNNCKEYLHFFAVYDYDKAANSLALLSTDLNTRNESTLQSFLSKRLTTSLTRPNEGCFCTLDFRAEEELQNNCQSVICYYTSNTAASCTKPLTEFNLETGRDKFREFITCLITSSEVNLEFFRPELHDFCNDSLSRLEHEMGANDKECQFECYLRNWYDMTINYLYRCVSLLHDDIALLFHMASMNERLHVECEDHSIKHDIMWFLNSCDLSELISGSNRKPEVRSADEVTENNTTRLKLTVNNDKSFIFSDKVCDDYCHDWAKVILDGDKTDPMFIKSAIENFKLMTVQSMNTFKRLVTDAEANHYALYRSFLYLKRSKQKTVLLANARIQDGIVSSRDALDVINILEQLI